MVWKGQERKRGIGGGSSLIFDAGCRRVAWMGAGDDGMILTQNCPICSHCIVNETPRNVSYYLKQYCVSRECDISSFRGINLQK